jgi:hypothetical protein
MASKDEQKEFLFPDHQIQKTSAFSYPSDKRNGPVASVWRLF